MAKSEKQYKLRTRIHE